MTDTTASVPQSVVNAAQCRQSKNEVTCAYCGDNLLPVGKLFNLDNGNLFLDWNQINENTSAHFVFPRTDVLSISTPGSSG